MERRVVKFQAWHKREHRMYAVAALFFDFNGDYEKGPTSVFLADGKALYGVDLRDVELREGTGLRDAKGTEVYAGDIVSGQLFRYGYELGEVDWRKEYIGIVQWIQRNQLYGFYLVNESEEPMELLYATHRNEDFNGDNPLILEIIGNIYEHPHLLGRK